MDENLLQVFDIHNIECLMDHLDLVIHICITFWIFALPPQRKRWWFVSNFGGIVEAMIDHKACISHQILQTMCDNHTPLKKRKHANHTKVCQHALKYGGQTN